MSDTRLNVFIQNLKDTTTVLQQLELCIKNIKEDISKVEEFDGRISDLETTVQSNTEDIGTLKPTVQSNTDDIGTLKPKVQSNSDDIDTLKPKVQSNTDDIGTLKPATQSNTDDITKVKNYKYFNLVISDSVLNVDFYVNLWLPKNSVENITINDILNVYGDEDYDSGSGTANIMDACGHFTYDGSLCVINEMCVYADGIIFNSLKVSTGTLLANAYVVSTELNRLSISGTKLIDYND